MSTRLYVSALFVYPIKSCRGIAVQSAHATPRGFAGDRLMMIVDEHGNMLTQRELPHMALIAPSFAGEQLRLEAPGMPAFTFSPRTQGTTHPVAVWNTLTLGVDQGDEVGEWLSAYLGRPARLVHIAAETRRPTRLGNGEVAFADAYPYLVLSNASLEDLSARVGFPVLATRFRPNVVIAGSAPFEEDAWREVRLGEATLELVKPCSRCAVVENDPETGRPTHNVLAVLATYRQQAGKVVFGQNAVLRHAGQVRIGDAVEVLTWRA